MPFELAAAIVFQIGACRNHAGAPGRAQQNDRYRHVIRAGSRLSRRRSVVFEDLATGRVDRFQEVAKRDGHHPAYIRRLVGLAFFEPAAVRGILQGCNP